MTKRYLLAFSLLIFLVQYSFSQQPRLVLKSLVYDYGTIKEDGGTVSCKFEFTNEGNADLLISSVRPSCGCTASEWTQTPIPPGGKGFIGATYDPLHRPGQFYKTITVSTNDPENANINLAIKGDVTAKLPAKADKYPMAMGNLRLKNNHLAMGNVYFNKIKKDSIVIYNSAEFPINIDFDTNWEFLKLEANPTVLNPDQEGFIIVSYDASKRNDWGVLFDLFVIKTNDPVQPLKNVSISAHLKQDYSKLSEKELSTAPKINFNSTTFDFKNAKQGDILKHTFIFTNQGKSNLIIYKTQSSCGCSSSTSTQAAVKKRKSGKINVEFNTTGKIGPQHITVTVISNDPNQPEIILHITGTVEK